jgi:HEAT repeats
MRAVPHGRGIRGIPSRRRPTCTPARAPHSTRTSTPRLIALHALSCQRCKAHPLCDYDLVPDLVDLLAGDPSPKVRHALVGVLARLVDDPRVRASLEQTSLGDPDAMVRQVASAALRGDRRAVRSRKSIRRHAKGLEVSATSKGVS